jgi:hypothetical protein
VLYIYYFKLRVNKDFFKRKFNTNKFGLEDVGFLALSSENKPAAYYGVFPCVMNYNGKDILVAQSGDTMTHTQHRGKGLFIKLAQKTYEFAKENGVRFVFGFPNQNSYPGFVNKLNWTHTEDLNVFKIKVTTLPIAKVAKIMSFFSKVYSGYTSLFYKVTSEGFENSVLAQGFNGLNHNKNFFDYKTYYPHQIVTVANRKVILKYDGKIWIGDIEFSKEEEYLKVINVLKRKAFLTGATEIIIHTSEGTALSNLLVKLDVTASKLPVGYLKFDEDFDFNKIKYNSFDLDTY